jgi:hypothetical protein
MALILCALLALVLASRVTADAVRDTYAPLPVTPSDLSAFERKRFHLYTANLFDTPSPGTFVVPAHSIDAQELVSFKASHEQYFAKHKLLRERQNEETIFDLQLLADRYQLDAEKVVKVATNADNIGWFTIPTFSKARYMYGRTVQERFCVLARFRSRVHFGPLDLIDDVPFDKKKNKVVWRGGPSGTGFHNTYPPHHQKPSREEALKRWCNNPASAQDIDIGLIRKWRYESFQSFLKNEISIPQMREYKYLLSMEGNDVATNLKWALHSNSVVLMPPPHVESWFAESLLKPYVHYVPIKPDFADLLDIKLWCDTHPKECAQIIKNAHAFVREFRNQEREIYLSFCVFRAYMHRVTLTVETQQTKKNEPVPSSTLSTPPKPKNGPKK